MAGGPDPGGTACLEPVASPTLGKDHPCCQMGRRTELRFPRRLNGPRRGAEARPEIIANPPGPSSYPMAPLSWPLETGRSDSLRKRPWARGSPLSGISFNTLVKMGSKFPTRNFIFNPEQNRQSASSVNVSTSTSTWFVN